MMRSIRRSFKWLGCGLVAIFLASGLCLGQGTSRAEYDIKAAYLYNFLLFVTWPQQDPMPEVVTIGVLGENPFGNAFAPVEGRRLRGGKRKLKVLKLGRYDAQVPLQDCSLLFVGGSEKEHWPHILAAVHGKPTLTVSDQEGFLEAGGMVNLIRRNGKVRWEISPAAIKAAGLRPRAQLLQHAVRVKHAGAVELKR
jgi:hypothetical protein